MASSIEIDIVANFKDNATGNVKALNGELDKIEKRNIEILAKVDGSDATRTIDEINQKANAAAEGTVTKTINADTSSATEAIDNLQSKIAGMENSTIQVNADVAVNGSAADNINRNKVALSDASGTYSSFNDASPIERTMEQIEKNTAVTSSQVSGIGSRYTGYDQSAVEYIEELEYLHGAADEYGIKYDSGADLNTMRNLVWGYEDQTFTGGGQTAATAAAEAAEDAAETALTGTGNYVTASLAQFGTRMATRMFGIQAVMSGITNAAGDFSDAFTADNSNDSNRSLARGLTKGGMIAAGAAIGSIIPGVGTLIGAGAGGLLSQMFGDDLADTISGITKSAEELKAERLDEIFGNIAMSAEDLSIVATNAIGTWETQVKEAHTSAISAGYEAQETASGSYLDILETGGKIAIKNNLGFGASVTEDESDAYQSMVEGYMDDVEDALVQEMYNSFMVNDDAYGYGNWDTTELMEKYQGSMEEFNTKKEALNDYLAAALSDGNPTTDEMQYISQLISEMQGLLNKTTPDEGEVKTDTYDFLMKNGLLSEDSYDTYLSELGSDYDAAVNDLASSRSRQIANGIDEKTADEKFWTDYSELSDNYFQTVTGVAKQAAGDDYTKAWEEAWNGSSGFNKFDDRKLGVLSDRYTYQTMLSDLGNSFENVSPAHSAVLAETYATQAERVESIEKAGQAGTDIDSYLDDLTEMYKIGALGGDDSAQGKYAAIEMLRDDELFNDIYSEYGKNYEALEGIMQYSEYGDEFMEVYKMLVNGSQELMKGYEGYAEQEDPYDIPVETETDDESPQAGISPDYDESDIELSSDIGEKVMNAINDSIAEMDSESLQDINFGETLMNAINEKLSAENLEAVDLTGLTELIQSTLAENSYELQLTIADDSNVTGTIIEAQTAADTFGETEATAQLDADDDATDKISSVSLALKNLDGSTATVTINVTQSGTQSDDFTYGALTRNFAHGTMSAPEGLAYVNDDGTSEPWELIEHNGEYMMYEGRNALAMLGAGDRVYTSSQTKAILSGESIPRYAGGLNNEVIENSTLGGSAASISIGGITVSITVDGAKGGIVDEIKAHSTEIAEVITDEIERHLSAAYANASASGG